MTKASKALPLLLWLLFTAGSAHAGPIASYFSNSGPAVPDNDPIGVSSQISVPDNFTINSGNAITVTLMHWTHTWVGDLIITLTGNDGVTETVIARPGGTLCSENFLLTSSYSFNSGDSGKFSPCQTSTTNVPAGNYETLLENGTNSNLSSAWTGDTTQGLWTLNVSDNGPIDTQPAGWFWEISFDVNFGCRASLCS